MLKRVFRTAKLMFSYKVAVFFFLTIGFIYSAINVGFVKMAQFTIDILDMHRKGMTIKEMFPQPYIQPHIPDWLTIYSLFYCCVVILSMLLIALSAAVYYRAYIQQWLCIRVAMDMRLLIARKILNMDFNFFSKYRQGDLLSRIGSDMSLLINAIMQLGVLLTRPIQIVLMACALFWINWKLALYGMVGMPVAMMSLRYLYKKMRSTSRQAQERTADVSEALLQFMQGIDTVKAFACEKFELDNYRKMNEDLFHASVKREKNQARERPLISLTSKSGLILVILIGGQMVIEGELNYGDIVAFLAALGFMYEPGKELSRANAELQNSLPGAERFFEVLDHEETLQDGTQVLPEFQREITFRQVDFSYTPDTPVLKGFELSIHKGETVALVGASGAGKSTLVKLLLRFYDPTSGQVMIDGHDMRDLTFESLRNNVAIVSQAPFLFNCSVRDNIAYGRRDAREEDIIQAAKAAHIHDEILALPNGYDTCVGDRGGNLSGGQRQRVTIARAIFKNPPILLLDEATSALDSENESKVQDALKSLMKNRTSVVIAHRLSTILHADRIVVMQDGHIIGQGKHADLLLDCPEYKRLASLQGLDRDL